MDTELLGCMFRDIGIAIFIAGVVVAVIAMLVIRGCT